VMDEECAHDRLAWGVRGQFLEDIERWVVDVRVKCSNCGVPFKFLGLETGLNYKEPRTLRVDGTEVRLPIHPANRQPPPLPLKGVKEFDVEEQT